MVVMYLSRHMDAGKLKDLLGTIISLKKKGQLKAERPA